MHLPRETNARNCVAANAGAFERSTDGQTARAPPIARILFGPTGARRRKCCVFFDAGAENAALIVDDQCARAAGAYVNSENVNGPVSFSDFFLHPRAF
jgi:hypothetical protein